MSIITVETLEIPIEVQTLDGFRHWAGGLAAHAPRVHFSKGRVFIEMSPQDYLTHGYLVDAINRTLSNLADEQGHGRYHVPPSWLTVEAADLSTEPDGFFVPWDDFQSGRVRVNPERRTELLGAPTMTLEVVSTSSSRKDLKQLVVDYAAAGVKEYWIADARGEDLVFRVLVLTGKGEYEDQSADEEGWIASPLFGRSFRLERFTNPGGLTDYRLKIR